jgi:hypothetical protein
MGKGAKSSGTTRPIVSFDHDFRASGACWATCFGFRLISYVEDQYKQSLHKSGDVKALANVDAIAALDIYAQKNQWDECLKEAEKHVNQKLKSFKIKISQTCSF